MYTQSRRIMKKAGLENLGVTYKVLPSSQMTKEDAATVDKVMATLTTRKDIDALVRPDPDKMRPSKWSLAKVDLMSGRVYVLKYKGVEVALMYQRDFVEVRPFECDPLHEGRFQEPDEAWVVFDLRGKSTKVRNANIRKVIDTSEKASTIRDLEVHNLEQIIAKQEMQIKSLTTQVKNASTPKKKTHKSSPYAKKKGKR